MASSETTCLASPNTMSVFGLKNRSLSMPANPGLHAALYDDDVLASSTLRIGMP